MNEDAHFIRGTQVSFYSTDNRSNTFGIYYRVKPNTQLTYCSLAEIETMMNLNSADTSTDPDMSELPFVTITIKYTTLEGVKYSDG